VLASGPARWREAANIDRRGLVLALLALASVPLLIGAGKETMNVFCPSEIRRYGGDVAYVKVLERFPDDDRPSHKGRGFPAGHASGGFALIGLLWLRRGRAWRAAVLALAVALGWWMGAYQMMKGAHFLSHTVFTMQFASSIALAWLCVLSPHPAGVH
jgi:membrane-associated PAP2 superfamily phosphatase